ncbi:MAG: PQQ-binding-like beta-propeller repeat protein [Acidobacteria bacterium]|nr:PQQ-binding-like beta-propeller repeat protein [Acidobacteriota bacterium]
MRSITRAPRVVAVAMALALMVPTTALVAQQEWPGFRGADGSAISTTSIDFETLAPEVVWRVEIGSGYSGVVVSDGRALTMVETQEGQFILALDADTGEELWRQRIADRHPGHDGSWDGPISTPVVHGGVVVGLGAWGRLVALDLVDGEPMWSVHLADDLGAPLPVYGFASSPLVVGDTLVVNGGGDAGTVLGFDLRIGEKLWEVGTESAAAQSPVRMTIAGRDMVVAAGGRSVFGIDPATGEVAWDYAHGGGGVRGAASMVPVDVGDDRLFLTHSGDAGQMMVVAEGNGALAGSQVWEARTIRSTYVPAVHHDGYIYGYNLRILSCVDAATGELMWRSRAPGDGFPMIVDGHLMVLTKDGTLHIARATPDGYQELVGAPVFEQLSWTAPSVAYGDVFARSQTEIVRIDLNGGGSRAIAAADLKVPRSLDPGDGEFGRFVRAVEAAADPAATIDDFFAADRTYPIHEGDSRVHFVYRGEGSDVAITGDMLGTRQDVEMVRVGNTDLYYYSAEYLPNSRLSYAFLRDGEMFTDPLIVPTMIYSAEREHIFGDRPLPMSELRMPRWSLPGHLREPDAATRGTVQEIEIGDDNAVTWNVYLPHGYAESSARYPVVYFHGPSPANLSLIPDAFDNLIADGLAPMIAVWTDRQLRAGPRYGSHWAEQLVPTIDNSFRTDATRDGRVSVGGGVGALAAFQVAIEQPEMTAGLAMLSIRALDQQWNPLMPRFGDADTHPRRIYLSWGVYGRRNPQEVWDNRVVSAERAQQLRSLGYDVAGGETPDAIGWASWRNRLDEIIRSIIPQE